MWHIRILSPTFKNDIIVLSLYPTFSPLQIRHLRWNKKRLKRPNNIANNHVMMSFTSLSNLLSSASKCAIFFEKDIISLHYLVLFHMWTYYAERFSAVLRVGGQGPQAPIFARNTPKSEILQKYCSLGLGSGTISIVLRNWNLSTVNWLF